MTVSAYATTARARTRGGAPPQRRTSTLQRCPNASTVLTVLHPVHPAMDLITIRNEKRPMHHGQLTDAVQGGTRRQSTEYHRQPRAPCRPRPRPGRLMHPSCKCTRADPLCIMDTTWGAAPASPGSNHARGTSTRARARARPKCKKCSSVGEEMHKSDLKFERASKFCPGGSVTRSTGNPTRHTTSWETHVPLQNYPVSDIVPRTGVADTCQTHYGQTGPTLHA